MKFDFTKPKKSKILIYDAASTTIADTFLPKKNYEIIHTRREKINIYILIITIFNYKKASQWCHKLLVFLQHSLNEIKIAEKFDEEGDAMFNKLGDEFDQKYRLNSSDQNTLDLHSWSIYLKNLIFCLNLVQQALIAQLVEQLICNQHRSQSTAKY